MRMQQVIPSSTAVVVLAQPTIQNKQELYKNMKHGFSRALIGLGAVQLCIGVLCIVFQCVSLGLFFSAVNGSLAPIAHGIWNGLLFLITGVFGIVGGRRKSRCKVVSFNAFSVISAFFTTVLLGIATPSAKLEAQCCQFLENGCYYFYDTSTSTDPNYRKCLHTMNAVIAMESMLAILAFIEAVVAIVSSAVCCAIGACCCGCGGSCCCPKSPPHQPQFPALGEHPLQQQQSSNEKVLAQHEPIHQLNVPASDAGYQNLYYTLENTGYSPLDSASCAAENDNSQYMDIVYDPEQTIK